MNVSYNQLYANDVADQMFYWNKLIAWMEAPRPNPMAHMDEREFTRVVSNKSLFASTATGHQMDAVDNYAELLGALREAGPRFLDLAHPSKNPPERTMTGLPLKRSNIFKHCLT